MITGVIRSLYDYRAWANQLILDTAAGLSEDQLLQKVGPSYGSLHNHSGTSECFSSLAAGHASGESLESTPK